MREKMRNIEEKKGRKSRVRWNVLLFLDKNLKANYAEKDSFTEIQVEGT